MSQIRARHRPTLPSLGPSRARPCPSLPLRSQRARLCPSLPLQGPPRSFQLPHAHVPHVRHSCCPSAVPLSYFGANAARTPESAPLFCPARRGSGARTPHRRFDGTPCRARRDGGGRPACDVDCGHRASSQGDPASQAVRGFAHAPGAPGTPAFFPLQHCKGERGYPGGAPQQPSGFTQGGRSVGVRRPSRQK